MSMQMADVVRQRVPAEMERLNVPACAVALIARAKIEDIFCFGVADRATSESVTEETRFALQSISKSIAGWAAMKLVEQGRLDLDSPISRYLVRWSLPGSDQFDIDLVTPRRILSHHAGITVAGFRGVERRHTNYSLIDALNGRLPPFSPEMAAHFDYWKLAREDSIVSVTTAPGSGWHYSNPGFGILEVAIEDLTGESYADFVAREILRPLNLTQTTFCRPDDEPCACPHDREGAPLQDHLNLSNAAAGAYASITDLAEFACAGMRTNAGDTGGRVLKPESFKTMYSSHGKGDVFAGKQFEAGLGHILIDLNGLLNVHHSGGTLGWRSIYSIFPETGEGICMLMNAEAANDLWQPIVWQWREICSEKS